MNILDIAILVCLIPAVIQGLRKGFIAQVVAIVSIVLGGWLAYRFSSMVSTWLGQWIDGSAPVLQVIAFILIFTAVVFGLLLIGKLLEASIRIILLGWVNRLLGLVFALMKYTLIIGLAVVVFDAVNRTFELVSQDYLNASVMYGGMKKSAYIVFPYLKQLLF